MQITSTFFIKLIILSIDTLIPVCRKDSLVTHRAFCDALAEESARLFATTTDTTVTTATPLPFHHPSLFNASPNTNPNLSSFQLNQQNPYLALPTTTSASTHQINAKSLLQRSCNLVTTSYNSRKLNNTSVVGDAINEGFNCADLAMYTTSYNSRKLNNTVVVGDAINEGFNCADLAMWQAENLTRDFLGVVTADSEEATRVEELVPLPLIFG
jgi:hypothetical protein